MWTIQRSDGAWNWFDCNLPPMEDDDYYGTALVAVAVGHAPDNYKSTEAARKGISRLRDYLRATPAPHLHHRALLLWASTGIDGLIDAKEREQTVAELLTKQRTDGGWSLTSLGRFERRDGTPNPEDAPGDGYGTGFVVYVLRQSGMPADAEPIRRGIAWLKTHQRASGRWFTRSPTVNTNHYITHAGTAYALMALAACGEK
jgi:squalene-hopene/tetraprenyl-beta-curcumene cyclase